ncbi:MAG: transporter substrate-binding domain-containing protein [Desulfobulbaceae bacterium]|nr:transporter substrate-binding domain-containing protein [Desulfobulbaceae bacterium]
MSINGKRLISGHAMITAVLFAMIVLCLCGVSVHAEDKELLQSRSVISSASEIDYPPFSIVDEEGRVTGFSVELLRAALAAMGRDVTFRTGPWAEVKKWLQGGKVQALPLVGRTPEREPLFDFTFPYMSLHGAIVVRKTTTDIQNLDDLRGRQVAVMKGDNAEEFLRREERGIKIHTTATFEAALRELNDGLHDAVVVQRLVALRLIQQSNLTNLLVINNPVEGFRQDFCFAVREGDRETLALLNEGLALVIADGTYRYLHAKWFAALQLPSHRRIIIGGDHNYPPFEYLDEDGLPAGFNVELTKAIAHEMDLDVEIRLGPWTEIRQALAEGRIDAVQGMFYSAERDLQFDFTPSHTVTHYVAVMRKGEAAFPTGVDELTGMRIVVQQGDIMHEFLVEKGLGDAVSVVDSQEEALRALAAGEYDCAFVARLTALYWISKHGWENLRVGRRPFLSPEYCYAVPQNHKALLAQLGEGLKVIDETGEYRRIYEKWLGVYEEPSAGFVSFIRYMAIIFLPLLLLLLAFFLWSWSLRKQVVLKTMDLRRQNQFIQIILDNLPIGLSVNSIDDSRTMYVNKRFEEIYGWPASELTDVATFFEKVYPDPAYREQIRTRVIRDVASRDPERMIWEDVEITGKDGRKRIVAAKNIPLYEQNMMISTVRDESDRKAAETALRESEKRFRMLVENSPDAIFVVIDGCFVYLNKSTVDLFGAQGDREILGTPVLDRVHPDFHEKISDRMRLLTGDKTAVLPSEEVFVKMDGSPVDVEVSAVPLVYEGRDGALVFARDITERIEKEKSHQLLQAQFAQAQKMESIGRLAGGVAHDFNNMLSVIIGYADIMMDKVGPGDQLHADIKQVMFAARRAADITRQLLAFARKQTVAPKILDLNASVENMLKMLRRLIGEDIDLAWRPDEHLWLVKIDPSQLDQVMANLCVNARDAIEGVGKVTIETKNTRFDESYCADHAGFVPGEYVMLAVSDDGRGMEPETQERVFEPFFSTKGTGQGTGLGLATVYGIIKQNQGFINIYSEPDKGTTFKIYLPRNKGTAVEEQREAPGEIPLSRGETILLVEDEVAILALGKRMLESLGYTVIATSSPGEAVELAEKHEGEIDLLVTDVVMPEMNGRELAERLTSFYPGLRVLFMSGYTSNVIAHRGVLEKNVNFIQKPFSKKELAVRVREVLDGPEMTKH